VIQLRYRTREALLLTDKKVSMDFLVKCHKNVKKKGSSPDLG
jgi:hypothetical protein